MERRLRLQMNERLCDLCNVNKVEDKFHFLNDLSKIDGLLVLNDIPQSFLSVAHLQLTLFGL